MLITRLVLAADRFRQWLIAQFVFLLLNVLKLFPADAAINFMRAAGGALFLAGALLMAFNVTMTILGRVRDEASILDAAALPAAAE